MMLEVKSFLFFRVNWQAREAQERQPMVAFYFESFDTRKGQREERDDVLAPVCGRSPLFPVEGSAFVSYSGLQMTGQNWFTLEKEDYFA